MRTGRRLHNWASRLCSARTMEQVIDPVIADLQHEHDQAKATRQTLRTSIVLLRGYCAFWTVLTVHIPAMWLHRTISGFRISHRESFLRSVVPAAIAMVIVNAVLIVEPARSINQRELLDVWLLILLLPQTIPFSIPLSIFTGIVWGLRWQPVTAQVRRMVLIFGIAGTLLSAGTMVWVVPVANQAFRTAIARRVVLKGEGEMSPRELREYAIALKTRGQTAQAGKVLLGYHARWALAGAALVFAMFGLGVTGLRLDRVATILASATAFVLYVTYFDQLGQARSPIFSHEGVAATFAWLPNLLILLTSIACLTKRDRPEIHAENADC